MSEHEDNELPPMSASMRQYVDAFAAVERPAPGMEIGTWKAIETEVAPPVRRGLWVATGAVLAVAAAVALVVLGPGRALLESGDEAGVQAQREGGAAQTGGEASERRGGVAELDRTEGVADEHREAPPQPHDEAAESEAAEGEAAEGEAAEGDAASVDTADASDPSNPAEASADDAGRHKAAVADPSRTKPSRTRPRDADDEPEAQPSLADELALIKRAKTVVDTDPKRALALLDEHDRVFPKGSLAPEATALRARALCAQGHKAKANALRERFLETHPSSTLGDRMRCE